MGYRVVIVGATGNVGREMLSILHERQFQVDEIAVLASRRSLGTQVSFGEKTLVTKDLETFDFSGWDIALFAIGSDGTKKHAPRAASTGCVVIDNSSLYRYDPQVPLIVPEVNSNKIYDYAKKNEFGSLDAPVSGGQAGAENGALTVMIGGDQADFDKAKDKIDCYSKKMKLLGGAGNGQLAKMVNQICIAGLVQGLSEAINFGMKAGLNMEDVIEVISKGAAQSWQMENRYKTMIDDKFEFGFAVDWMRKDLGIAIKEAENNTANIDITKTIDEYYKEVQAMGGSRWDTSSLLKRLQDD